MLALSLAWIATLTAGYFLTEKTVNQQLDAQMQTVAQTIAKYTDGRESEIETKVRETFSFADGRQIEYQIWQNKKLIGSSPHAPQEGLTQNEGYSQNSVEHRNWWVFSTHEAKSQVMVGEDLEVRKGLVHDMVLSALWPMLIAWPLIALTLWISVSRGLKPLSNLASEIKRRSPEDLGKIVLSDVPTEVAPIVSSLNRLFTRVSTAVEREQEFADNAAHELRSPLTAIKTYTQVAIKSTNENERVENLRAVSHSVDRASKMVTQLLTLARLEPERAEAELSQLDLNQLAAQVISKLTVAALERQIDVGLLTTASALVNGNADQLEILLTNLIDNSIRHGQKGGIVNVSVAATNSSVTLRVEDNGPGIRKEDRRRVFDRFTRLSNSTEGSGIGLAIVDRIVSLHNAKIELSEPSSGSGLIVRVEFPPLGAAT
jgi:two-component system, OmpR family, sensor histidine kinase QseC